MDWDRWGLSLPAAGSRASPGAWAARTAAWLSCRDAPRVRRRDREGHDQGEDRPSAQRALDEDASAHHVGQPAADRQPEPEAAGDASRRAVDLGQVLEDPRVVGGVDADPRVDDADPVLEALVAARSGLRPDRDAAPVGELDRIVDQVRDDLTKRLRIADDEGRLVRRVFQLEPQVLLRAFDPRDLGDVTKELGGAEGRRVD